MKDEDKIIIMLEKMNFRLNNIENKLIAYELYLKYLEEQAKEED